MKKIVLTKVLSLIMLLTLIYCLSSCRTSGYGCKGKESWGKMTKRINRP